MNDVLTNINSVPFPIYSGLESSYEHNVYQYLKVILEPRGYQIKIKKTTYKNIDNAMHGAGQKSCDAYILKASDPHKNLVCLFELESTDNLKKGIVQVYNYCKLLHEKIKDSTFVSDNKNLIAFVFDGQKAVAWTYDLENDVVGSVPKFGFFQSINNYVEQSVSSSTTSDFLDVFPKVGSYCEKDSATLAGAINNIRLAMRAHSTLQKDKAFLITCLASIFGKTEENNFDRAISELENRINNNDSEAKGICEKWKEFESKIQNDSEINVAEKTIIKDIIKNDLYRAASELYEISRNENVDLYGFIYEELATVIKKSSDGEYYTPRSVIRPVVNCLMNRYLVGENKLIPQSPQNDLLKKSCSLNVVDIFCGSGGFLYEYLKFYKRKFGLNDQALNSIAEKSMYGMDKNNVMAAFLNMYLIGDGNTTINQVTTSINWDRYWAYEKFISSDKKEASVKICKSQSDLNNTDVTNKLKKNIGRDVGTFSSFVNIALNLEKLKKQFDFKNDYIDCKDLNELFCKYQETITNRYDITEFYKHNLINSSYEEDPFFHSIYEVLNKCSNNVQNCPDYEEFKKSIGNVDILMTNIPYGPCSDVLFATKYSGPMESLALLECIDLLRPSNVEHGRYEEDEDGVRTWIKDMAGSEQRNCRDGGYAAIVIPNGILESEVNKELRDYLFSRCDILAMIKLPIYTFAPYATIQTFVMVIRKKPVEMFGEEQSDRCFFYIVDCDGKANSKNRFSTTLKTSTKIKLDDTNSVDVIENLHDDLSESLSSYPNEGFISKLERAWLYGDHPNFDEHWNQVRYMDEWDGNNWAINDSTKRKWYFSKLRKKVFSKRKEIKNKQCADIILAMDREENDFEHLTLNEQKQHVLKKVKLDVAGELTGITYQTSTNRNGELRGRVIRDGNGRVSLIVKNVIKEFYENLATATDVQINGNNEVTIYTIDSTGLENIIVDMDSSKFTSKVSEVERFLDIVEDLQIRTNMNDELEVKFYMTESYEQFTITPEDYLDKKQDFMSLDEIIVNIMRLHKMMQEK